MPGNEQKKEKTPIVPQKWYSWGDYASNKNVAEQLSTVAPPCHRYLYVKFRVLAEHNER
jgi:hypothetical protein